MEYDNTLIDPSLLFEKQAFATSEVIQNFSNKMSFSLPAGFNHVAIVCYAVDVLDEKELTILQNTIKWLGLNYSECLIITYNKAAFPLIDWQKQGIKKMIIFGKEAVADYSNIILPINKPFFFSNIDIIIGEKLEQLPTASPEQKKIFATGIKQLLA